MADEKNPPSTPESPNSSQSQEHEEHLFAVLGYASIGCFIPLTLKPKSEFCQFHGKQGLVLFLVSIMVLFILALMPGLGLLLFMAYFALVVIAMFRAYNGEKWAIPLVSTIAKKINLGDLKIPSMGDLMPEKPKEEIKTEAKVEAKPETKEESKEEKMPPARAPRKK